MSGPRVRRQRADIAGHPFIARRLAATVVSTLALYDASPRGMPRVCFRAASVACTSRSNVSPTVGRRTRSRGEVCPNGITSRDRWFLLY